MKISDSIKNISHFTFFKKLTEIHKKKSSFYLNLALILSGFLVSSFNETQADEILLKENFQGTEAEDWIFFGGNWNESGGVMTGTGDNESKAINTSLIYSNFMLEVEIKIDAEGSQAGIVYRLGEVQEGFDKYDGYYAGLSFNDQKAIMGKSSGSWTRISDRSMNIERGKWYPVKLIVHGNNMKFFVYDNLINVYPYPKCDIIDQSYINGKIGLRVLGGSASFRNLEIKTFNESKLEKHYLNPLNLKGANPDIFKYNGVYYLYCTNTPDYPDFDKGIRLHTSIDLVNWKDKGYVLKSENSWGKKNFWAPEVIVKNNRFMIYYSTNNRVCVAASDSPTGPFTQIVKQPMEPGTIQSDPHIFQDDDGVNYFYYFRSHEIWGGVINDDMISVKQSTLRLMINATKNWEGNSVAGAEVIKYKGTYYMTFSGNQISSAKYSVGFAIAENPLGPWRKYKYNPIIASTSYAKGIGQICLTRSPDGLEKFIAYHRHSSLNKVEPREIAIDRIQFVPQETGQDVLEVWGPTMSPQPIPSGF